MFSDSVYTFVGLGQCIDVENSDSYANLFDHPQASGIDSLASCANKCIEIMEPGLVALSYNHRVSSCTCHYVGSSESVGVVRTDDNLNLVC